MSRIIDDPEGFFSRLVPPREELLLALEREAAAEGIPIVGPVVGRLLEILVRASGARRVLELGCATGYSAIFLARGLPRGGKLSTVEHDPAMHLFSFLPGHAPEHDALTIAQRMG